MSDNPQWDISRALGVARLFNLVCGVRDACVTPFLTLYLRQLGLTAPWVGILMGTKHLITAFWAPFCAFLAKRYQKRRVLLMGSLLGSMGASLLMVLVPPLDKDLVYRSCNGSSNGRTTTVVPLGVSRTVDITTVQEWASSHRAKRIGIEEASGSFRKGLDESDQEPFSDLPSYSVDSVEEIRTTPQVLLYHFASLEVVNTLPHLLPEGTTLGHPTNLSVDKEKAQNLDLSLQGLQWTFIFSLGFVVFWELLTAPLEQVADGSLYEYLDYVDATDYYRSLWVWRLLGMSAGVCGITALVEQLDCYMMTSGPGGVAYFYGYSLVSIVATLVSIAFPVPICRWREPSYKTVKALPLIGGNPHLILLAFSVFLVGAATSTVQNFLFWNMKDHGSSELGMGFAVALSLLGEMLLHPFKVVLLRKLSRVGTVGLGLGCLAVQLLYYSFLWNWWSVFPVQILSALSSGALWWAVGASLEDLATPGTERSLSSMFRGHFYRGGSSLGSFVGGFVVMYSSLAVLYQACCVVLLFWLAAFLTIQARLPQERKINYSKLLAMEVSDTSDSEEGTERDWLVKAMKEEHLNRPR
ncbi:PREDICTED: major facilitator superfamily domain-containing protein 6-like [Chrysochloris asiatica]|uniref:Major facilitator superfamily domain-containing protein 6-like n=1 Tax=Chrysochloris asiatica TaxID=185453 RepID=A0A9B0WPX2_CHRAS|nr:PREDICTED: major facilitator superfamily domain-containing protein 6-like [Chrysochloris asiatica]